MFFPNICSGEVYHGVPINIPVFVSPSLPNTFAIPKSDIFILPSYAEGLPIAILEAMAAKLPVISTSVGSIPEVIKEKINGYLIKPGDYKALANRIILLAKNKSLRMKIGNNNRNILKRPNVKIILFIKNYFVKLINNV